MADLTRRIERFDRRLPAGSGRYEYISDAAELRRSEPGFVEAVEQLAAMRWIITPCTAHRSRSGVLWLSETLCLVPDERDAAALGSDGVSRGADLDRERARGALALPDRTSAIVRRSALVNNARRWRRHGGRGNDWCS
jgi:hypothetical protein